MHAKTWCVMELPQSVPWIQWKVGRRGGYASAGFIPWLYSSNCTVINCTSAAAGMIPLHLFQQSSACCHHHRAPNKYMLTNLQRHFLQKIATIAYSNLNPFTERFWLSYFGGTPRSFLPTNIINQARKRTHSNMEIKNSNKKKAKPLTIKISSS